MLRAFFLAINLCGLGLGLWHTPVSPQTPPGSGNVADQGVMLPDAAILDGSIVRTTLEPGGEGYDSDGTTYQNTNFWMLCGPGAIANTMYYWGIPTRNQGRVTITDPQNGVRVTFDDSNGRAYIMYLGYQMHPTGWTRDGMIDHDHYPSLGVTQYTMVDALNWEASGHDPVHWHHYFYRLRWWNDPGMSPATLYHDAQRDIGGKGVPMVAEVDANLLPNWPGGHRVNHQIAIIGYDRHAVADDGTTGVYYYVDSCGSSTLCGATDEQKVFSLSFARLWKAITGVPVNRSHDPRGGDGGWIA